MKNLTAYAIREKNKILLENSFKESMKYFQDFIEPILDKIERDLRSAEQSRI